MTEAQRRQILQEWRLLPEPDKVREPKTVSSLVEAQLSKLGLADRLIEDQLAAAWESVVGAPNASMSRPVSLKKGELIVAVAQPALKYTFERFHAREILTRLQERFGTATVRVIRFRTGN
jgi:predicted nucleic acid-binding Zn ribbon protein